MLRIRKSIPSAAKAAWLSGAVMLSLLLALTSTVPAAHAAVDPAKPNDPLRVKQTYLDQIHAPEAWAAAAGIAASPPIVVALVDTGVDLTHPDLQGKLTSGYNLLDPAKPPQDDNGHGTNVAGVIAAAADNDKGIAGIAQNVRIMPIKALEADGRGDEAKLGEGIRYAVDHGARIVVLSLGLYRYNERLAQTVQYAEQQGVLLVAATGNEGDSVNYPAAYPTVVAVGGVDPYNQPEYRSNIGPEIDLVAPYDVFTTTLGGGYGSKNGTSMAAPQAAAVAALAWSKYPWMKPYQLRSLLRQTAEDLNVRGWDEYTGYGLLRADRALLQPYREDPFEPNDQAKDAKTIPVNKTISAEFAGGSDIDWFKMDSPYDGALNMKLETNDGSSASVVLYDASLRQQAVYEAPSGRTMRLPVKRGYSYLKLQAADTKRSTAVGYRLTTDFQIYADPYEPNDKQYEAFVLPAQSQVVKGTFDHPGDVDWFMLPIEQSGKLTIRLSADTARMDPILLLEKKGEKASIYDEGGNGADETASLEVFPGDYYIRVSNQKNYTNPIMGQYTLSINYTPEWLDPNEPNDKPYQAASLSPGTEYPGTFETADDQDWFQLDVAQDSLLQLRLTGVPEGRTVTATIVDNSLKPVWSGQTEAPSSGLRGSRMNSI
ncbi:S8 family peptidase [Gordoniibacillus kamchatkensis]|uniref:S8 family peptidase n=1 Tax=Gordoniibacillus kamchatkensis TaxID=1590651 RepID=UPI000AEA02B9|nr:S8 family serine peptidase [Paenibacillus sp. VKM B-2647]